MSEYLMCKTCSHMFDKDTKELVAEDGDGLFRLDLGSITISDGGINRFQCIECSYNECPCCEKQKDKDKDDQETNVWIDSISDVHQFSLCNVCLTNDCDILIKWSHKK